jgi:hypothetical protein
MPLIDLVSWASAYLKRGFFQTWAGLEDDGNVSASFYFSPLILKKRREKEWDAF